MSRLVASLAVLLLIATACAPRAPGGTDSALLQQARAPKILTLANNQEPPHLEGLTGAGGRGGAGSILQIVHNGLAGEDDRVVLQPQLAVELPSVERGTWVLNPDGTMDVTWKLHPNVKWHDGTPFTSADLLFSFGVYRDPELPTAGASTLRLMGSASAPDPYTFVIHWTTTYVKANESSGLSALPRHILEDLYARGDKDAFVASPYFREQFVGLGPYRLTKWELGSHLELARFDDYYRGRPAFDQVIVRFVLDANAMVANILAGSVDVVLPPSVDLTTALELRQRWEGTGNQVVIEPNGRLHFMEIQRRPDYARPRNGLTNQTVRQALLHALDRQELASLMAGGMTPAADSYVRPTDPWRADVESAIVKYPYDLNRAQQLLSQAGWARGSDGVLVHGASGERFEGEIWARQGAAGQEKEPTIVANQWSAVGARLTPYVIPSALEADREYQALLPTLIISGNLNPDDWYSDRLHSRFIASVENRWSGRNKLGYANPRVDPLLDQLQSAIDPRERAALHRQLLQEETVDVAFVPLYWEVLPVLMLKGVKPAPYSVQTLRFFGAWDRE